ncbi:MAG: hypothetical protein IT249_07465 [Chitinophagaceae bacterium]|nr:hypothetical protein [Chitinophagaceae bacterium]
MFPFYSFGYFYYIIPVLQIICILHALKTNRRDWIYILIFLPGIGCIIYLIREVLPDIRHSGINSSSVKTLFPSGRIKELERNLKIADTDANRLHLAEEYARQQNFEKAIKLTGSCLKGIYAKNVDMMLNMGRYSFGAGKYAESLSWLDKALAEKKNKFERPEDELLYAKALHYSGNTARAEAAYKQIIRVHHSMEGRYYYGLLLKETERNAEAKSEFNTVLEEKDLHPKHVRRMNSKWVSASRKELRGLKAV